MSPQAPDGYELDDTRSILGCDHGQVTLIDHDPVKLLLCYEPPSILDKIFGGRGLGANQYQGGLSTLTRMSLKMVNPHLPHTPEHVSIE